MNAPPIEVQIPTNSRAAALAAGASFADSWRIASQDVQRSALDHFIAAAKQTPQWVDRCMTARNRVGRCVGLKDLGRLADFPAGKQGMDYRPGERVGIFTVSENTFEEAVIGDSDRHLNVALSIHRELRADGAAVDVTVTTIVHVKNLLGRLYMLPVKPMHRLIAPIVLSAIGSSKKFS